MDAKAEARAELWTERKAGVWTDDDLPVSADADPASRGVDAAGSSQSS
jgi:hypothetical protein